MGQGQDGGREDTTEAGRRDGEGALGSEDAVFEEQMRSLGVRPAGAVRGGRGRPRAGRGKRPPAVTSPARAEDTEGSPGADDAALFLEAVAALDGHGAARAVATRAAPSPDAPHPPAPGRALPDPNPPADLRAEDALFVEAMTQLERAGGAEGAPDPRDELFATRRTGVEQPRLFIGTPKRLRRRIRSGEIQAQAELDLHGLRRDEARRALAAFVRDAVGRGHEVLRIICGRGLHSAQGPVLRQAVRDWLLSDHRQVVAEVVSAPPAFGGEGVWYAFLRRFSASPPER